MVPLGIRRTGAEGPCGFTLAILARTWVLSQALRMVDCSSNVTIRIRRSKNQKRAPATRDGAFMRKTSALTLGGRAREGVLALGASVVQGTL